MIDIASFSKTINEHGELPFDQRFKVLKSLNRMHRGILAYKSAKHVEAIWNSFFPDEHNPFDLLEQFNHEFRELGMESPGEVSSLGGLQNYLDEKFDLDEECYPGIYSGYSAWAACHVMCNDEAVDSIKPEDQCDPDDWGPAFYASCAYSGGAYWSTPTGDVVKRREFWSFWLSWVEQLESS